MPANRDESGKKQTNRLQAKAKDAPPTVAGLVANLQELLRWQSGLLSQLADLTRKTGKKT